MSVYREGGVSYLCIVKEACHVCYKEVCLYIHVHINIRRYVYLEMSVKCMICQTFYPNEIYVCATHMYVNLPFCCCRTSCVLQLLEAG